MDHLPIHIGMILSILSLNINGFVFGLFPEKISYDLDIIHTYIIISHPIFPTKMGHYKPFGAHSTHMTTNFHKNEFN